MYLFIYLFIFFKSITIAEIISSAELREEESYMREKNLMECRYCEDCVTVSVEFFEVSRRVGEILKEYRRK